LANGRRFWKEIVTFRFIAAGVSVSHGVGEDVAYREARDAHHGGAALELGEVGRPMIAEVVSACLRADRGDETRSGYLR
jgi:hypothetical protein